MLNTAFFKISVALFILFGAAGGAIFGGVGAACGMGMVACFAFTAFLIQHGMSEINENRKGK